MTRLCECGCGRETPLAKKTNRAWGHVKGEPLRFLHGHKPRSTDPGYVAEDGPLRSPCWIWQRALNSRGYGLVCLRDGSGGTALAHRVEWERVNGPVPADRELHHMCERKDCVNPDHLVAITRLQHRRIRRRAAA